MLQLQERLMLTFYGNERGQNGRVCKMGARRLGPSSLDLTSDPAIKELLQSFVKRRRGCDLYL